MKHSLFIAGAALCGLSFCFQLSAQPIPQIPVDTRVERWNDLWMAQNNYGGFVGNPWSPGDCDPCPQWEDCPGGEFPGGSGQEYLSLAMLWIGAVIDSEGYQIIRVSTGTDGWLNPSINELWAAEASSGIGERSRLDTMNCIGENIYSALARADHEFTTEFFDTLTAEPFVIRDPIDGRHKPLGIKVARTTYAMIDAACNHILWIRHVVTNIGPNILRDLYFGMYVDADVLSDDTFFGFGDDLAGFETTQQLAYVCDNDGRPWNDSSGNDFTVPNVTGLMFLSEPKGIQRVSFNWWDYRGPAWAAYADRDSLGMGWTDSIGTPVGDLRRYQLLSNGEQDYDQVRAADSAWIASHPQDGHAWSTSNLDPFAPDIANGADTKYLLSFGPLGTLQGQHTEMLPGDSVEVWCAYVGGLNFHDPARPQPTNRTIDPSLFDFSDLIARAQAARAGNCLDWANALAPSRTEVVPAELVLHPLYPNPFNAQSVVRFTVSREAIVRLTVFDLLGREVERLAEGKFQAGRHALNWDARALPSGIYWVTARTGESVSAVQKAVVLR